MDDVADAESAPGFERSLRAWSEYGLSQGRAWKVVVGDDSDGAEAEKIVR
ncbi:MAG: hypothetical protein HC904_13265 [Blastochloris sp.]|nr:hypothetical protein [Blastochloris sp.]